MHITPQEAQQLALEITAAARKGKSHSSSIILEVLAKKMGFLTWSAFKDSDVTETPSNQLDSKKHTEVLFEGTMHNWDHAYAEQSDLSSQNDRAYEVKVRLAGHGQQLDIAIAPPHTNPEDIEGEPQLCLFVEINNGRPLVCISNSIYGDNVLLAFSTEGGLFLEPFSGSDYIATGYPNEESLRILQDERFPVGKFKYNNGAFILAHNYDPETKKIKQKELPPKKYVATFIAQTILGNKLIVTVPALGERSWDVTDKIGLFNEGQRKLMDEEDGFPIKVESADDSDKRKALSAPQWVQEWSGPYILIIKTENAE